MLDNFAQSLALALELDAYERATGGDEYAEDRARLEGSYREFVRDAWPIVEPSSPLAEEWYIDALCDHLQAWEDGEIKDLLIHIRPRTGKTNICSVMLNAWAWARDPSRRYLWTSYSKDRTEEDIRRMRGLVLSDWFQRRWPIVPARDQNQKHRFALDDRHGGHRYCAIYGTGATGDGGDRLGMDDPQQGRDMYGAADLRRDEQWFYDTFERRRNDERTSGILGTFQRLGPFDLGNALVVNEPKRWERLCLQTRRVVAPTVAYYRQDDTGRVESFTLPAIDTTLSRDGRFIDPRAPGDLLSLRVDAENHAAREANPGLAAVVAAQDQQAPILASSDSANLYTFNRAEHVRSFAGMMGARSLREAVEMALADGWRASTGWDHSPSSRREWGVVSLYSERVRQWWVIGCYVNSQRTTPEDDAWGMRRELDRLGVPCSRVVNSRGDVGDVGALDRTGTTINRALSTALDGSRRPILGFPIAPAKKGAGSVETGVEVMNTALGAGCLYFDPNAGAVVTCVENWGGGEAYKDGVDALRYDCVPVLQGWQRVGGASGIRTG